MVADLLDNHLMTYLFMLSEVVCVRIHLGQFWTLKLTLQKIHRSCGVNCFSEQPLLDTAQ